MQISAAAMHLDWLTRATLTWNPRTVVFSLGGPLAGALGISALCVLTLTGVWLWLALPSWQRSQKEAALEDRLRGMIEQTSDIIHIVSPQGKFLYVNGAWRKTFGYTEEEIAGLTLMEFLHPEERARAQGQIQELMAGQPVIEIETRFLTKNGRTIWVEGNSTCEVARGKVVSRRGIFRNITERMQGEEERARLMALLEEAPDFIASTTPEGRVLWLNRAFRNLRGLGEIRDFAGLKIGDFHPAWSNEILANALQTVLTAGIWQGDNAVLASDGREIPVSQTIVGHRNASGKIAYLSALCRDITESRRAEEALREAHTQINVVLQREKELARTDVLTGLANRRAFHEALQMERSRAVRYGRPITLAYVDLDNFKRVNDTLGHAVGDELLARVADLLRHTLRASDTVGRLGGDEFALLLPETGAQPADALLKKLAGILTEAMHAQKWPVTFSIGAAAFLDNPPPVEEMIRTADELMYSVKKSGKNRVSVALMGGAWQASAEAGVGAEAEG